MAHSVESLGEAQKERLAELEKIVSDGLRAFVKVGKALTEIRDQHLYSTYTTFEEYCRERWEISIAQAYRLIDAATIVEVVTSPNGETLPPPANEAQARALAPLKSEPDRVREVWGEVVKEHGESITAPAVRAAVDRARGHEPPPAPKTPPVPLKAPSERSWQLVEGDLVGAQATLDPSSVDAVVTKPPPPTVDAESVKLYDQLFGLAARTLCDGGSLGLLVLQGDLLLVLNRLEEFPALDFRWLIRMRTGEQTAWAAHVHTSWQPVVWATKGRYRGEWVNDHLPVRPDDPPLASLVAELSEPGNLILDPFCGSGLVGEAAITTGRDFLGVEDDPVSLGEANRRREALFPS